MAFSHLVHSLHFSLPSSALSLVMGFLSVFTSAPPFLKISSLVTIIPPEGLISNIMSQCEEKGSWPQLIGPDRSAELLSQTVTTI